MYIIKNLIIVINTPTDDISYYCILVTTCGGSSIGIVCQYVG
jgi:hypothetical protein